MGIDPYSRCPLLNLLRTNQPGLDLHGEFEKIFQMPEAEAWAEKYAKPAQPDLNVLTGQAKAEAWIEKYGKPAQPDQAAADARLTKASRLEELARIKDGVTPGH